MKLRNKRTGDIWEFDGGFSMKASRETTEKVGGRGCSLTCYARSLAELNKEWEDYKPTEPLIKDEKIRKAVRAWADKANIEIVRVDRSGSCLLNYPAVIQFFGTPFSGLKNREYTIAELCGEEEE